MTIGDKVRVTREGPFGVFPIDTWNQEGRLRNRLYFDPDITVGKGTIGTVAEAHDITGEEGWWIVKFDLSIGVTRWGPFHESSLEAVT